MELWLVVALWAGLTLIFLRRLQVILANIRDSVGWRSVRLFGREVLGWPQVVSARPYLQLIIWFAELLLLCLLYDAFGVSVAAHLVASVVAAGLMFTLRDRQAGSFLQSIQLVPDHIPFTWNNWWSHQTA